MPGSPKLIDKLLASLPQEQVSALSRLIELAAQRGTAIYLVGGPVRDVILGRAVADVDLLVETKPGCRAAQIAQDAAPDGARVRTHERCGTLSISTPEPSIELPAARGAPA